MYQAEIDKGYQSLKKFKKVSLICVAITTILSMVFLVFDLPFVTAQLFVVCGVYVFGMFIFSQLRAEFLEDMQKKLDFENEKYGKTSPTLHSLKKKNQFFQNATQELCEKNQFLQNATLELQDITLKIKELNAQLDSPKMETIQAEKEDTKSKKTIQEELNALIGLDEVKVKAKKFMNFIRVQKKREEFGLATDPIKLHMMFKGNSGTGKTTMARILAKFLCSVGVLSKGHLTEVDRTELVGEYIGGTEKKTRDILKKATGGVLFIDEAYSLAVEGKDFGKIAVDILVKEMEDNQDIMVIFAGYPNEMNKLYELNPGLKSRVPHEFLFENYNDDELILMTDEFFNKWEYIMDEDAKEILKQFIRLSVSNGKTNDNGRWLRNVLENVKVEQANRLDFENNLSKNDLLTLKKCDVEQGIMTL